MSNPVDIDKEMFESMCSIFATQTELCQVFKCSLQGLKAWVRRIYNKPLIEVYNAHAGKGKMSLRRAQFKLAQNNAQMAIWLGKQYLGQVDRQEQAMTLPGNVGPQKVEVVIKDETNKQRIEQMENKIIDEIKQAQAEPK